MEKKLSGLGAIISRIDDSNTTDYNDDYLSNQSIASGIK